MENNYYKKNKEGFIALITTVIISMMLMTLALAVNNSGFYARGAMLEAEYKERSRTLAEGCVDYARLKRVADPNYVGNETVALGNDTCTVLSFLVDTPAIGQITIKTTAVFQQARTNLKSIVKASDLSLVKWNEVASF